MLRNHITETLNTPPRRIEDVEGGYYLIDPNQFSETNFTVEERHETYLDARNEAQRLADLTGITVKVEAFSPLFVWVPEELDFSVKPNDSVERQCLDLAKENERLMRAIERDLRVIAGLI